MKHLGMGLDEKAVEAVRHYRLQAGHTAGKEPSQVRGMDVEVTFHIS